MTEPKPTKENIELGNRIKTIRLSLGKDVRSFGDMVKPPTSGSVVSRWERGINKPNAQRLKSIADLGNVSVDYLLTGRDSYINEKMKKTTDKYFTSGRNSLTSEENKKINALLLDVYNQNEDFETERNNTILSTFSEVNVLKRAIKNSPMNYISYEFAEFLNNYSKEKEEHPAILISLASQISVATELMKKDDNRLLSEFFNIIKNTNKEINKFIEKNKLDL